MSRSIGEEKSQALLAFHAFTGCDQTSSFAHYGKKAAWEAWGAFDDVTAAFQALSNAPTVDVVDEVMPIHARRGLFTHKGRDIEAIPPPQLPYVNIQRDPCTRLPTAGAIPWCRLLRFRVQVIGAG